MNDLFALKLLVPGYGGGGGTPGWFADQCVVLTVVKGTKGDQSKCFANFSLRLAFYEPSQVVFCPFVAAQ